MASRMVPLFRISLFGKYNRSVTWAMAYFIPDYLEEAFILNPLEITVVESSNTDQKRMQQEAGQIRRSHVIY